MFSIIQSAHVAFVSEFPWEIFLSVLQERVAAAKKFHSKEAEEEAKKVPAKTFTPGLPDAQDITMEPQGPKVVAPTPEQIIAIKVVIVSKSFPSLHSILLVSPFYVLPNSYALFIC